MRICNIPTDRNNKRQLRKNVQPSDMHVRNFLLHRNNKRQPYHIKTENPHLSNMRMRDTSTHRNIRNVFNLTVTLTVTLTSLIIRNSKRSIDRDIDLITYS